VNNRGRTRHSGRALRPNADRQVIERVTVDGGLLTASQAAERFGRRRSDVDHLIRTGWLQARPGSIPVIIGAASTRL